MSDTRDRLDIEVRKVAELEKELAEIEQSFERYREVATARDKRLEAELQQARQARSTCACAIPEVEPCHPHCSCRHPHMSMGCIRCASYGSKEQRIASAQRIVERESKLQEAEAFIKSVAISDAVAPSISRRATDTLAAISDRGGK